MNIKETKTTKLLINLLNQEHSAFSPFFTRLTFASLALTSLVILGVVFSLPAKASQKYIGDWFETEIILFSQLDDKSKLKEAFSSEFELPDYQQEINLLGAYLNSDIDY